MSNGNSFKKVETGANGIVPKSSIKVAGDLVDINNRISELESLKLQQLKKQAEYEENQRFAKSEEMFSLKKQAEDWQRKSELYKDREDIDEALANVEKCVKAYNELINPDDMPASQTIANEDAPTFFEQVFSHWLTLAISTVFFLIGAFLCYRGVEMIGDHINALNSAAMSSGNNGAMLPPSISMLSYQKLWYSGLLMFCSLLVSLLVMAIVAPAQLFFILPFTLIKNQGLKWKNFYNQSESQKQWQSFGYFALILLFISGCLVK